MIKLKSGSEIDPFALEKGDEVWQCFQLENRKLTIVTEPVIKDGIDGRNTVEFFADETKHGMILNKMIRYYLTKGLEHYGPRFYTEPTYNTMITFKKEAL